MGAYFISESDFLYVCLLTFFSRSICLPLLLYILLVFGFFFVVYFRLLLDVRNLISFILSVVSFRKMPLFFLFLFFPFVLRHFFSLLSISPLFLLGVCYKYYCRFCCLSTFRSLIAFFCDCFSCWCCYWRWYVWWCWDRCSSYSPYCWCPCSHALPTRSWFLWF